jgi:Ca2+-binding RTX toxin-like protein
MATLIGTESANTIKDTSNDPTSDINGLGGNDKLYDGQGVDTIQGGLGDDLIFGDSIVGSWGGSGTNADPYYYENEAFDPAQINDDVLLGDAGRDTIYGGYGNDKIDGGDGNDGGTRIGSDGKTYEIALFGGAGNDIVHGGNGDDTVYGNKGNDYIYGDAGNDFLYGGNNDDHLFGGTGNDTLSGGNLLQDPDNGDALDGGSGTDGATYYFANAVTATLDGSLTGKGAAAGDTFIRIENLVGSKTGSDVLAGNTAANTIRGYGGNDTIHGRAGNDNLLGNTGADRLYGEAGRDWLNGGTGADTLNGGAGPDGADYYDAATAVHVALDKSFAFSGEAKGDVFVSIEDLGGTVFADLLAGNSGNNAIWSNRGNDELFGRSGNDYLYGEGGNDKLHGDSGNDWLHGGAGVDVLDGGAGLDGAAYYDGGSVTQSLDGSLTAKGYAIGDQLILIENLGGSNTGNDTLAGNSGANELYGEGGNDTLFGRAGIDSIYGGFGADTIIGGDGKDKVFGGDGADTYRYDAVSEVGDTIEYLEAHDRMVFKGAVFGNLKVGILSAGAFHSSTTGLAHDTSDRFVFNTTDKTLHFDSNGSDQGGTQLQIAKFLYIDTMTNADIVIV